MNLFPNAALKWGTLSMLLSLALLGLMAAPLLQRTSMAAHTAGMIAAAMGAAIGLFGIALAIIGSRPRGSVEG